MNTILVLALVLAGNRNLFQYVEDPRPPKKKPAAVAPVVVPVVIAQKPVVVERQVAPPTFEFPFEYIGSFGPDDNVIAVFVGEGVVTARVGDSFADAFVVREIRDDAVVISRGEIVKSIALRQ